MTAVTTWLSERMLKSELLVLPGVYDGLSALITRERGAEAVYAGGFAATAANYGLPDLGLLGLTDMIDIYRRIKSACGPLPLVVDADTGHGGLLNVQRTVHSLASIGAAACHIEDQVSPKRCGHMAGKEVVDRGTAVARVSAAVEAATGTGLAIIARTDALASLGFDEAVVRAKAFLAAGATLAFVDAPQTTAQIGALPGLVGGPLLFNAAPTGVGPALEHSTLVAMGYRVVIHPIEALLASANAIQAALAALLNRAPAPGIDFRQINKILGAQNALDTEARLARAALPETQTQSRQPISVEEKDNVDQEVKA
jgi:2-methylisocitrate lyase-like PEP mutase family enzyme